MYTYLLTIRANPADVPFFEEFLPIFFTKFCQNEYYWSIEKDGTCDRHLHYLSRGENPKDIERVVNKFKAQIFQNFKNRLKDSESTWIDKITEENPGQGFLNIKTVPKDDFGVTLGYILKDAPARRYTGNLKSDDIEKYINLHYINVRNKAKTRDPELDSLKILSGRTMVSKVIDYCKRTNTRYDCPELYYNMVQAGHFFYNISNKIRQRAFRELRIYKDQENSDDKAVLLMENNEDYNIDPEQQQHEDIITLLKMVKGTAVHWSNAPVDQMSNTAKQLKYICYRNNIIYSELDNY